MSHQQPINGNQGGRVRLRPETWPKWLAITKARRWTLSEAADALADEFLERHQIQVLPAGGALIRASTDSPRPDGSVRDSQSGQAAESCPPSGPEASPGESPDPAISPPAVEASPPDD